MRGICCLRPGVPGVSENIRVSSVVGRFLEHSRVFSFGVGEEEEIYISSADWMPRNFYRRVELMTPILDEKAKEKIRQEVLEPITTRQLPRPGPPERRLLRPPPPRAGKPPPTRSRTSSTGWRGAD